MDWREFWQQFRRHKAGMLGLLLLLILVGFSALSFILVPLEDLLQWRNPVHWTIYPRSAAPAWTNMFYGGNLPEHLVLSKPEQRISQSGDIKIISSSFAFQFRFDSFPGDFLLNYELLYGGQPPLIELRVLRPDGDEIQLLRTSPLSWPQTGGLYRFNGTLYSTDRSIKRSVAEYVASKSPFAASPDEVTPSILLFAEKPFSLEAAESRVLKGVYTFTVNVFLFGPQDAVSEMQLIIGGKIFGLLGTDDLRRDLFAGIIWGTPLALFIGIAVSLLAVAIGMVYGVVSGYSGGRVDESMMRVNDVIYAIPTLPLLIILAVSLGKSIIYVIFYLVIFGWVGIAKVARSIAIQIKTMSYVEAAELLGASKWRVMFKHIMPQIAPYAFASIALSVPSAILAEAGLSFLGLGDPTLPTWGQILHDAQAYSAAARGLWWWILPPGMMIALTSLAFVLLGMALDQVLNPKMRKA